MRSVHARCVPFAVLLFLLFLTVSLVPVSGDVSDIERDSGTAATVPAGSISADSIPVLLQPMEAAVIAEAGPATGSAIRVRLQPGVFTGTDEQRFRIWLGAERGYRVFHAGAAMTDVLDNRTRAVTADGNGFGALTLSADGELFGSLWLAGELFEIGPAGEDGEYRIVPLAGEQWSAAEHQALPVSAAIETQNEVSPGSAAAPVIDLFCLTTPALARQIERRSDGRLDEGTEIAGMIAAVNATLERSGAATRLRLAGVEEVAAKDDASGDDLLLEALRRGDDGFAAVARQRAALGADLVILFLPEREGAAGSTALRPMCADDLQARNGFAIVRCGASRATNELSLTRAFGSLMGLAGGAAMDDTDARRPFIRGAWGYYFGSSARYAFGSAGERGTVMTSARRIVPFFATPLRTLDGQALGSRRGRREDADAVRALDAAATLAARYQAAEKNTPPESISWTVGEYNVSTFLFKDLQGFDDFSRIHIEFSNHKLDRVMEFTYSPKTDIWALNIKHEGVVKGDLIHNIQGNQIGGSFGYILLNPLLESSLVKYPRKLGFRMNIRLEEDPAINYRVRTKAYDTHGTTRGWKTMGKIFSGKTASTERNVIGFL